MPPERPAPFLLQTPEHFKALAHPVRHRIVNLLRQRPATLRHLTEALGLPKGTVAYHAGVLQDAGMARVVEMRQVRGGTEQYLGLVNSTFKAEEGQSVEFLYRAALAEMLPQESVDLAESGGSGPRERSLEKTTLRHLWLTPQQARALLGELKRVAAKEGQSAPGEGEAYGLLISLFRADTPTLPPDEAVAADEDHGLDPAPRH